MKNHNDQFYRTVIQSEPRSDSLAVESLSKDFLRKTGSKARLVYDSNVLETYNIAEAFSEDASGYLMTNEDRFTSREVKINVDFLCEEAEPFDNNNSLIVADAEHKNLMVVLNDHETIWLVGEESFLRRAQPYPLEIMKDYYLTCLDDDPSDPTAQSFWETWNEYEQFMLK